jgi:hypothetical protein
VNRGIAALKVMRAWCALLTCAALCTGSAAFAQPHSGLPDVNSDVPAEPGFKEIAGSNPCPRWGMEAPEDRRQIVYDDSIGWMYPAWIRICMESVRSDAIALAWAHGLDEYGVPRDADARASQLEEMEGWLRRLKGKFRIEGRRWYSKRTDMQVLGTADCFGIGSGPGVSCLISAEWKPDEKSGKGKNPAKVPDAAIRPQILLFGLDPGAMQIRVTHVDAIAVALQGILQDGVVILSEQSPPEVFYAPDPGPPSREDFIAMFKGTFRQTNPYLASLNRYPLDSNGNFPRRLSRIAMTPGGDVDMKFFVLTPGSVAGYWNQPIEFDLQLLREREIDAVKPGSVPAANFTCARPTGPSGQQGVDEVEDARSGVRKESGTRQMQAWLARLVGQYSVEGYVDLCGQGKPKDERPATGTVDCIAAGSPPSVHCKVDVSWPPATSGNGAPLPGGVSNLAPAQFLFSLYTHEHYDFDGMIPGEPTGGSDRRGLHFLQLDNRGIAEWASSELVGDTFLARENCVDIPGNCHKITRITARPAGDEISIRVDVEIDRKRVLRQVLLLHRRSGDQK